MAIAVIVSNGIHPRVKANTVRGPEGGGNSDRRAGCFVQNFAHLG